MFTYLHAAGRRPRRRAVVAVQVGVVLVVLLGFAALTVDLGTLYNTRSDLQRTADAAALAGVSALVSDEMMEVRLGTGSESTVTVVRTEAGARVTQFAAVNPTLGTSTTAVASEDIATGWIDLTSATSPLDPNAPANEWNAVRAIVRRDTSINEPVPFYFSWIFGKYFTDSSARAVAAFDDRVAGFTPGDPEANLTPFTIHEDAFERELVEGGDSYGWNDNDKTVFNGPDDIREVRIYPYPLSGSGSEGDGNFGFLNIGTGHQGVDAEREQILNGVTTTDLEMEIGTPNATFYDDEGAPVTYEITGSPGMETTLQDTVRFVVGDVIGFFLHDNVALNGSNSIYTITGIRFGRVMDIRLTGPPHQRGLWVQPVTYVGTGVDIDPNAPSTNGMLGRIVLVR